MSKLDPISSLPCWESRQTCSDSRTLAPAARPPPRHRSREIRHAPHARGGPEWQAECLSDGNVPTTSSAAQIAWSARCPVVTLGKPPGSRLGKGLESDWSSWLRNGGAPDPGTPGQVRSDGTRSALPPKCSGGERVSALEQDTLPGHTLGTSSPEVRGPPGPAGAAGSLTERAGSPSLGRSSLSVPPPGGNTWGHLAWQDAQIPPSRWKQTFQIEESAQPILKMWSEHLRETDVQGHTTIPGCIGVQARRFSFCLSGLKKSGPLPRHLSRFCLLKTLSSALRSEREKVCEAQVS